MSWFVGIYTGLSLNMPKVDSLKFRPEDQGIIKTILTPSNPVKLQMPVMGAFGLGGKIGCISLWVSGYGGTYAPWDTGVFKQAMNIGGELTCAYHPQQLSLGFLELTSKDFIGGTFGMESSGLRYHTMPVTLGGSHKNKLEDEHVKFDEHHCWVLGLQLCKSWKQVYISTKIQYLISPTYQKHGTFIFKESEAPQAQGDIKGVELGDVPYQFKMHNIRVLFGIEWRSGGNA